MATLYGLMLVIFMATMWSALISRRYLTASALFCLSTATLLLLISPRVGISFETVGTCAAVVAISLLIGAANYWLRRGHRHRRTVEVPAREP